MMGWILLSAGITVIVLIVGIMVIVYIANERDTTNRGTKHTCWPKPVSPEKRAGMYGEQTVTNALQRILREDDILLSNVEISYENKPAELDNVIINQYGVFIIEVKNHKGRLYGAEEDFEWRKFKDDGYGNKFFKTVKNPIKQVKRQVYILANYLKNRGINVWVEGYVVFLWNNCPVESEMVVHDLSEIDRVIHTQGKNRMGREVREKVRKGLGG